MMKRIGYSLGLVIACLTIWSTVGNRDIEPAESREGLVASAGSERVDAGEQQELVAQPEVVPPQEEPFVIENQDSAACEELSRLTETTGLSVGFAPGLEVDDEACARAVRSATNAMMPALPGLAGFEVRDIFEESRPNRLANEVDDPAWAREMEGRILNSIAGLIDFPVSMVHAVCRTSTCGLLFSYRSDDHGEQNQNEYARQLADALGFSGYYAGVNMPRSGNWFMTIYLGDWETQRPDSEVPTRPLPQSFSDIE